MSIPSTFISVAGRSRALVGAMLLSGAVGACGRSQAEREEQEAASRVRIAAAEQQRAQERAELDAICTPNRLDTRCIARDIARREMGLPPNNAGRSATRDEGMSRSPSPTSTTTSTATATATATVTSTAYFDARTALARRCAASGKVTGECAELQALCEPVRDKPLAMPSDCAIFFSGVKPTTREVSDEEFELRKKQWQAGVDEFGKSDTAKRYAKAEADRKRPSDAVDDMLTAVGFVLFKCAWPTAIYERFEILNTPELDANLAEQRASVALVRLHGKSAFNDGPLSVKISLEYTFREGAAKPLRMRFGENSAVLAQPGTTLRSQFVRDLGPKFQEIVETVCPNPP